LIFALENISLAIIFLICQYNLVCFIDNFRAIHQYRSPECYPKNILNMEEVKMYFFDMESVRTKQLLEGVTIKTVYGERIMMSFADLEAGLLSLNTAMNMNKWGMLFRGC